MEPRLKATRGRRTQADPAAQVTTAKAARVGPNGRLPFPIVGTGASAGGLEALQLFLRNVPAGSGMAFVIVQHQDPTHKTMLPELLQRTTTMEVEQVKNRTRVQPEHIYVIPPNKDMFIRYGLLHLLDPAVPRGLRLPIDLFFRSLAEDTEHRSIVVLLSGMGSDGTVGIRAIKGMAGAVFVQDPMSAKFDGMPQSAIDTGLADVVAQPEDLPGRILAFLQRPSRLAEPDQIVEEKAHSAFAEVVTLLRTATGHDFSFYKKNTMDRRIKRRMGIHKVDTVTAYVRLLQKSSQELDLLFKELLIGVTNFFRDPASWEKLKAEILLGLRQCHSAGRPVRAWVPGCSTGEEAYSLAIVIKEAQEQLGTLERRPIRVFATDLDHDAIEVARAGVFPKSIAVDVSAERLRQFFIPTRNGYQVCKPIREMVIFAEQNLIMDPPFTKLDVLSCRNLLIYLAPDLQKKLIPLFHYCLNPGAILFLGSSETIGGFTHHFEPVDDKWRLYRRRDAGVQVAPLQFPAAFVSIAASAHKEPTLPTTNANISTLVDQLILQRYSPAAVLTGDAGDILYISGRSGKYLEPVAGKANWNIFAMAREGLRYELSRAFQKAVEKKRPVTLRGATAQTDGGAQAVDVTVEAITAPESLRGLVVIVFTDVGVPTNTRLPETRKKTRTRSAVLVTLEQELLKSREELRATHEEMQASQEELKSANEELQSANEELQSRNEEMTTSREEMQSMNEELQMVNHELHAKLDELSNKSNDMKNLLDATDTATIFLDDDLTVRLFTPTAIKVFKLIPGDVGRPLTDIVSTLQYPELAVHAREVLRTLATHEEQVATQDGRWFEVRILPYRTLDNLIDGVVITFADISASKAIESSLRNTQIGLQRRIGQQDLELAKCANAYSGKAEETTDG